MISVRSMTNGQLLIFW